MSNVHKKKLEAKISIFDLLTNVAVGFLVSIISLIADFLIRGFDKNKISYIIIAASVVIIISFFTIVISKYKKGSAKVSTLKMKIKEAYLNAINESILNPDKPGGASNVK